MLNKLLISFFSLFSMSAYSVEAKEVDWKVLQGLTMTEDKGKSKPKLSKELKVAIDDISIKGFMMPLIILKR